MYKKTDKRLKTFYYFYEHLDRFLYQSLEGSKSPCRVAKHSSAFHTVPKRLTETPIPIEETFQSLTSFNKGKAPGRGALPS